MVDFEYISRQLQQLFDTWKHAHRDEDDWHHTTVWESVQKGNHTYPGVEKDSFVKDGIIGPEYNGKVLFILKEANIIKNRSQPPYLRDQVEWYKDYIQGIKKDNRPKQLEKMGRMYCSFIDKQDNPSPSEYIDALKKIAFINLNKRGGDNVEGKVQEYTNRYCDKIIEQIAILQPEYIVCLGTFSIVKKKIPLLLNTYKIFDIWHPAYTRSRTLGSISVAVYLEEFRNRTRQKISEGL